MRPRQSLGMSGLILLSCQSLVGASGFEPLTPATSKQCSTAELCAYLYEAASSSKYFFLKDAMPVPAGISLPIMTFSFNPYK